MRPFLPALVASSLMISGCVVSETEQGPGPGDRKKESSTDGAPVDTTASTGIAPSIPPTTPGPDARPGEATPSPPPTPTPGSGTSTVPPRD